MPECKLGFFYGTHGMASLGNHLGRGRSGGGGGATCIHLPALDLEVNCRGWHIPNNSLLQD